MPDHVRGPIDGCRDGVGIADRMGKGVVAGIVIPDGGGAGGEAE